MTLREQFVLRALEPSSNKAELCREFGISRKTGYKWIERFRARGTLGLADLSRRPHCCPLQADGETVLEVIRLRTLHARWGPKKLRAVLQRSMPRVQVPSIRTIARILERAGQVTARRRRARLSVPEQAPTVEAKKPNDLWTVDFKGWWLTGDKSRAEPLTVRDAASRYVLCAQLMTETGAKAVRAAFEQLFELYGMPDAIQADNGVPFACTRALGGLTNLSAWWVALGIRVIRGRPGHPEDNGAHERMHGDMYYDLEANAASNLTLQQSECDRWRHEFNHVRPHEALQQRVPADCYRKSTRPYRGPRVACYPQGWLKRKVSSCGQIKVAGTMLRMGDGLRGYYVGLSPAVGGSLHARFYELELGQFKISA